jgi:hypothetical protein
LSTIEFQIGLYGGFKLKIKLHLFLPAKQNCHDIKIGKYKIIQRNGTGNAKNN